MNLLFPKGTPLCVLLFSLALFGCGGDGNNSTPAPANNNPPGGGSNVTTDDGVFLDSAVEGLSYTSGSVSGVTDANGTFSFEVGQSVTFSIGDIALGTTDGAETITPLELVSGATGASDPQVVNIIRFLQTLDDDGDASNGIQIPEDVRNAAANETLDFTQSVADFETNSAALISHLTQFTTAGARLLIDEATAVNHFQSTLNQIIVGTSQPGELTLSGPDTGEIGTTFSPSLTTTSLGASFSSIIFSHGIESLDITLNENHEVSLVQYIETKAGTINTFYHYSISCNSFLHSPECDKVVVDLEAETVTFADAALPPITQGSTSTGTIATGPLTIRGTLSFAQE